MSPLSHPILLGLVSLPIAAASANAQSVLSQYGEVVIAVGDAVPGLAGVTISNDPFENVDNPVIDQNGTIVFRAHLFGGGVTPVDDRAYLIGRANGDLQIAVRASDQAPGCPAGTLLRNGVSSQGLSNLVRISPSGELLFFASNIYDPVSPINTPTSSDSALFWGPVGGLFLLAREGEPVPFLATGENFGQMNLSSTSSTINSTGQVLFGASLTGGVATASTDGALVTGTPGNLSLVLREGETLPTGEVVVAATGATNLSSINFLNQAGQVLHEIVFSTSAPSTATAANNRALAIWTPGSGRTIIAREGQQAPVLPAGVLFATPTNAWLPTPVGNCNFTNSGKTLLNAALNGGGTTPGIDDSALYFGGIAGWTLVLRKGDLCPGLTGGERFGTVGENSMSCTDAGGIAFLATLTGPSVTGSNDTSTWIGMPGNLVLLAREGDLVPGMAPSGVGPWRYGNITAGPQTPNLNGRGFVLFENQVTDGVATRTMWFGYTPARGVVTVLDGTDTFSTGLGTTAWTLISTADGANSGDQSPKWFGHNGDFVAKLFLAGAPVAAIVRGHLGSFVAEPSSIPAAGGVTQNFHIDLGPAYGNHLYIVLASGLGTSPGFLSPLGPQTIPLNFDPFWTQLSLDLLNSVVWQNSLWVTDASGRPFGVAPGFRMPPGFPGFEGITLHHAVIALNLGTLASEFVSEPAAVKLY